MLVPQYEIIQKLIKHKKLRNLKKITLSLSPVADGFDFGKPHYHNMVGNCF